MLQDSYSFTNDSSGVIAHDVGAADIDLVTTSTQDDQHAYQQPGHAEEALEDLIASCAFFNPVSSQTSVDYRIDVLTILLLFHRDNMPSPSQWLTIPPQFRLSASHGLLQMPQYPVIDAATSAPTTSLPADPELKVSLFYTDTFMYSLKCSLGNTFRS